MILGRPGPNPRGGVLSAFSTDHLSKFSRRSSASGESPTLRAHWLVFMVKPSNVINLLFDLLLACSSRVAQRQLLNVYGPSLSGKRSIVCFGDGNDPISAKKASNECHLAETLIPLPPYRENERLFGFSHLLSIPLQILCSAVLAKPWEVLRSFTAFLSEHRQTVDRFERKFPVEQVTIEPHTHRHSHLEMARGPERPRTVREPNIWPVMSNSFIPILCHTRQTMAIAQG